MQGRWRMVGSWSSIAALVLVTNCRASAPPGDGGARSHAPAPPASSASPSGSPAPGPPVGLDGSIVISGDDDELWAMSLEGNRHRVTDLPGPQFDGDWSPDGQSIVFRDSAKGVNVNDEIAVIGVDGSGYRNLTATPDTNEWGPAWSPDGSWIALSSDREGLPQIYVMKADGTQLHRLSHVEGEYPTWSPDGTRIAFASNAGGATPFGDPNYDIFVMAADGTDERNITNEPDAYDMYPSWSADGRTICFESTRATPEHFTPPPFDLERTSDFDIWVMRPDGSGAVDLTPDLTTNGKFPDWSSDGRVVFDRDGAIVVMRADGSGKVDISERTGFFGNFPAWQP